MIAEFNVLGVLDDAERKRVLGELRRVLVARGLLIFSAHNIAFIPNVPKPAALVTRSRNPARILWNLARLPLRERNHRRIGKLERHERDYALINDQAHDYRLLHYYIGRDAQAGSSKPRASSCWSAWTVTAALCRKAPALLGIRSCTMRRVPRRCPCAS